MYRFALIATTALLPAAAIAQTTAPAPAGAPAPTQAPAPTDAPAAGAPAAPAAAGAAVAVGATIYDAQGGVVGTVASTDGTNAVIDTGTVKAGVPIASIGTSPKGPTLGLSKAELEAAAGQAAQAQGDIKSQLTAGTAVYGTGGTQLGTVKAADAQFVTLTTAKGDAKLPIGSFGPGPKGVTIGMTQAQLDAAMGGAK